MSNLPPPNIRLNSGESESSDQNGRNLIPERPSTTLYPASPPTGPQDRLLPPSRQGSRFKDDDGSTAGPPGGASGYSSRRTSWSSDTASRDSRTYAGANPFDDSRAPSRADSDDENLNTQTVSEKYNILPSAGLLLFPEDVEKDDYLHNPGPNDNDRDCDIWNRRGFFNLGGLILITIGLLFLFIGYPAITFIRHLEVSDDPCQGTADCLGKTNVPLLKNIRRGLVDPDTPQSAMKKTSADGVSMNLVFSDEFNVPGRVFYPNDDPYFTAVDIWYGVTMDLEWYDPDAVTTADGVLQITFSPFQNHGLNYRSGMVQSWNQMCFTGGRLEASLSLPGSGQTIGFWPGFWIMGNLGRPGYAATTDGMWPYSYHDECDAGITPNQSMSDGTNLLPGMRLPACTCDQNLHPTPGKSRSAPEIDVIEASVGSLDGKNQVGVVSQSAQFAPFDLWWQADYDFVELYDDSVTVMNVYEGGPYQQTISGVTNLNNDWYDGNAYQTYAIEYTPGAKGDCTWFVGDTKTWHYDYRAVRPNGNIGQRVLPVEPMAIVMNFGMSNNFAALNYTALGKLMPAHLRFDYVRVYQPEGKESVTCDPPGYETTSYIRKFPEAYNNPNLTHWSQTPYEWPKNALMHQCQATDPDVPVNGPSNQ